MDDLIKLLYDDADLCTVYAETRQGGRKENQDNYGYVKTDFGFLVTVCDGMGGGPGGRMASTIAVREIIDELKEATEEDTHGNILIKAIRRANLAIIQETERDPSLRGMGTTCTVALFNKQCATVAHVGDSRIYQLRGKRKVFRTDDHSMVFEMVKQNIITEEQARLSAQSNIVTRALGIKHDVEVDVQELPYCKGDRFILCTDGVHGSMPEQELIALAAAGGKTLGGVVDNIATTADSIGNNAGGGHDNLTLAMIETNINSEIEPAMNRISRILLGVLAALLLVSLAANVYQWRQAKSTDGKALSALTAPAQDSIAILVDSLNSLDRQMQELKRKNKTVETFRIQLKKDSVCKHLQSLLTPKQEIKQDVKKSDKPKNDNSNN